MANTIRSGQYEGIRSQEGLDMITDSEAIVIRVGVEANQKTWHLHKKLLTTNSTFFAAALDGGFAEQNSKTVTLPEVLSEDFQKWVHWLYLGELHPKGDEELDLHEYKESVRLWNLGDMLGCPMFQDAALTTLAMQMSHDSLQNYGMPPELLAFIWDACAPGSKLRKFAIDYCIIDVRMARYTGVSEEVYIQFAEDNEDFARAYAAASIANGHRKRRDLLEDLGDYFSITKSNK